GGVGGVGWGGRGLGRLPVVGRVGGLALRPAPDQPPVRPDLAPSALLGGLSGEVLPERLGQCGRDRNSTLAPALGPHEYPAALPLRAGGSVTGAVAGAELRALPAVGSAFGRAWPAAGVLAPGRPPRLGAVPR